MTEQVGLKLNLAKQLLLSTAALLAIAMPVVAGAMGSPLDSIQLPSHSGPVLSADDAAVSARDIGPSIAPTIETERSPQHALAPKVNGFQGDIAGDWQGTEQAVQGPLRIVVRVSKTGNGWSAVEYSLDQAARGVTCSEVTLKGTTFEYQVPSIGGAYKGRVSRDGKSIAGFWTQNNGPRQRDMVRATKDTAWEVPQPLPPDANPSFSVATIKPSDQSVPGGYFVARGRNFSVHSGSLALMIEFAYNVHIKQIVNGPDWMDQEKFDIAAISDLDGLPSIRQWSAMFQKLLTSRFGLTFHRDRRQLSVYALTVEKDGPKNLTLDASAATPPRLVFRTVSGVDFVPAKNAAMSDFAKALQEVVDRPVVDETGITGRYDFTLTWAAANYRSGHVSPTSEDQSSPPNLFNALREQLNLRLDAVEMPADVLIIDHVEQPSEN